MPRQIGTISYASLLEGRPKHLPTPKRLSGSRAKGVTYEKKAVRELKERFPAAAVQYHRWIHYVESRNGSGYCEPEVFIELKDRLILFEMKLTGGPAGRMQLEGLYKPLLEHLFRKPVFCLLVCKWTTPATPGPFFNSPEEFMLSGAPFGTWHWLP